MGSNIVGSACLKLKRQFFEYGLLECNTLNHLSPTLIRWQAVEPRFLAIKHTDTCRTIHLMSAEYKELTVNILHIHTEMGSTLRSIYKHRGTMFMGNAGDFLHWINRTKDIAHMGNAHQLGALVKHSLVGIHINVATFVHRNDTYGNATLGSLQLPWHDIRMVLHHRNNHLVALCHKLLAKRGCNKIKSFCSATGKNYLIDRCGIDKTSHRLASSLMKVSSLLGEIMHTTMHIGIDI